MACRAGRWRNWHGIMTQPIMLPDNTLLSGRGLDRKRHLVFPRSRGA